MGGGSSYPPAQGAAVDYIAYAKETFDRESTCEYTLSMDPLSLTASIIAVVGLAGTATRKLTRLTKELYNVPSEVYALNNEVADLQHVLQAMRSVLEADCRPVGDENDVQDKIRRLPLKAPDSMLGIHFDRARKMLAELNDHLQNVLRKGNRAQLRINWIRGKTRTSTLQCELRNIRKNLQTTLSVLNVMKATRIELIVQETWSGQKGLSDNILQAFQTGSVSVSSTPVNEYSIAVCTSRVKSRSCTEWCSCICHKKNYLKLPKPLTHILGSLFVGYSGLPINSSACNQRSCQEPPVPSVDITYYFPTWFLARAVLTSLKFIPLAGPELVLRMPRLIRWTTLESDQFLLAKAGNTGAIQSMLVEGKATPFDLTHSIGESALFYAACFRQWETCKFLIDQGADRLQENKYQVTPMDCAWALILSGRLDQATEAKARALFDEDQFFETRQFTLIHKIVLGLSPLRDLNSILQASTEHINDVDTCGRSSLSWAAGRGDFKSVRILLQYGAETRSLDNSGFHPLHYAVVSKDPGSVQSLLDSGAAVNSQDALGHTPLHLASQSHDDDQCLRLLVAAGADINAGDNEAETPLMYAARNERIRVAESLLDSGADPNAQTIWGMSALDLCVRYDCPQMLKFLLQHEADYMSKDIHGKTILHQAAQYGSRDVVVTLIEMGLTGVDRNLKDLFGKTIGDYLEERDDVEIARQFLSL